MPAALLLALLGLTYRLPAVNRLDQRLFLAVHRPLSRAPWGGLFRFLWPLGTTPAALLLLLPLRFFLPLRAWMLLWAAFALAALLERGVKLTLRRPRPFTALPDVRMLQPRRPHDPSFPSGDALRVWFLALAWGAAWPPAALPAAGLAALVSLGRLALGVHHPLDVLSGGALGALAAWGALHF